MSKEGFLVPLDCFQISTGNEMSHSNPGIGHESRRVEWAEAQSLRELINLGIRLIEVGVKKRTAVPCPS